MVSLENSTKHLFQKIEFCTVSSRNWKGKQGCHTHKMSHSLNTKKRKRETDKDGVRKENYKPRALVNMDTKIRNEIVANGLQQHKNK